MIEKKGWKIALMALWLIAILIVFCNRNLFTAEEIINASPQGLLLSSLFMLGLFALKSVTVVLHSGALFTAAGMIYEYPYALLVGVLGTVVMSVVPYWIGQYAGKGKKEYLLAKYPKLEALKGNRSENGFLFVLYMRVMGFVPSDILGFFMGSEHIAFPGYLAGSIAGLFSGVLVYTSLGHAIESGNHAYYVAAAIVQAIRLILSWLLAFLKGKEILSCSCRKKEE